jgi:hypothetical protein
MFLTLQCYYDCQLMTLLCSSYYNITMFLMLKHLSKPHIVTMRICSSDCNDEDMFITLRKYGHVYHIAMMGLCLSHCDDRAMFATLRRYYVCQNVTLLCSSHCDDMAMFITLRQMGYVCDIAMTRICLGHCDVTMFARF